MEYLFTFANTHFVIKGEKLLGKQEIVAKPMPLPTSLGSFCGICLRISNKDLKKAQFVLNDEGIPVSGIFEILGEGRERKYLPWKS